MSCPNPPLLRQPAKSHEDRANALRDEMCRLASWSQTPHEVALALMAAVKADNARLNAIAKAEAQS